MVNELVSGSFVIVHIWAVYLVCASFPKMKSSRQKKYDVAVIGGGPAGMMAAGRAAECGARVVLLEKNEKLGKKLLITGGGRCNITNAQFDLHALVAAYGQKGKALFGPLSRFGVAETIDFFTSKGLPLKTEAENRVFPVSDSAVDVWRVFFKYLQQGGVEIRTDSPCIALTHSRDVVTGVTLRNGTLSADAYVLATGGMSHPETGSTGGGLKMLQKMGHTIHQSDPALVPITIEEKWIKKLSGLSFSSARLSVFQGGKKYESKIGKLLLTHFGLSGPLVLNMSRQISELFHYAPVTLKLDLYPDKDEASLDRMALEALGEFQNKKLKNSLSGLIQSRMADGFLHHAGVDGEKEVHSFTRAERHAIVRALKGIPLTVTGFLGPEKAIVTAGGVSLKEVDFKHMRSKLFPNLFLAGDVLDFDRPSGGYSLQICWTTGYVAGEQSAEDCS